MKIKILSDSTCDLSAALVEANDIAIVPLTVIKNDQEFKDTVNITPDVIFEHVANGGNLCSTSANSVGEYEEWFAKYANDYDGIIHINIGSGFSSRAWWFWKQFVWLKRLPIWMHWLMPSVISPPGWRPASCSIAWTIWSRVVVAPPPQRWVLTC